MCDVVAVVVVISVSVVLVLVPRTSCFYFWELEKFRCNEASHGYIICVPTLNISYSGMFRVLSYVNHYAHCGRVRDVPYVPIWFFYSRSSCFIYRDGRDESL